MREIRFRCFNAKTKKMLDADSLRNIGGFALLSGLSSFKFLVLPYPQEDYILMQYTGLKDKNEKEIYECDILKVYINNELYGMGKVVMVLGCWSLEWIDDNEAYIEPIVTTKKVIDMQELEVVGNIYENPELLEDKLCS